MVDASADPNVVTAVINRETQEAAAERAAEYVPPVVMDLRAGRTDASAGSGALAAPSAVGNGTLAVPAPASAAPEKASFSPGMVQMLVAAAIVAVLIFVWVAERRSRIEER